MSNQDAQDHERTTRLSPLLLKRAKEMRREPAPAEKILCSYLRDRQLINLKFRRQVPIGNYIADFYCAARRVIVELDGESHLDRVDYDRDRTAWLNGRQLRVLRLGNHEVFENVEGVLMAIASAC